MKTSLLHRLVVAACGALILQAGIVEVFQWLGWHLWPTLPIGWFLGMAAGKLALRRPRPERWTISANFPDGHWFRTSYTGSYDEALSLCRLFVLRNWEGLGRGVPQIKVEPERLDLEAVN